MNATAANPSAFGVDARADRRLIRTGIAVVIATFGVFGGWAAVAPLHGAVIVQGVVGVEAERKTVQHLEGGIVRRILVKPGSIVKRGDALVQLEDVQADAVVNALRAQLDADTARTARLEAERGLAARIDFPADIAQRLAEPAVTRIVAAERALFAARRKVLDDQVALLRGETRHIRDEIASLEEQGRVAGAGVAYAREQLALNEKLQRENFVAGARVLEVKGQVSDKEQKRSEASALAAQARQKVKQNELRIEGLRQAYVKDAADELRVAERRVDELRERLRPSVDTLARATVTAPIDGEVVDLRVHTVGGVIAPREPLMDIVPAKAPLIIKARARTDDITHLRAGAPASIQLTAYRRRTTPVVEGTLAYVSADMLVEQTAAGPVPYYDIRLSVERDALAAAGDLAMVPGMPVEVYVRTQERTVLEYLLQPITQAMRRAGRES